MPRADPKSVSSTLQPLAPPTRLTWRTQPRNVCEFNYKRTTPLKRSPKVPVTIRLAPDEIEAVDAAARENRLADTRSAWIRWAVLERLDQLGKLPEAAGTGRAAPAGRDC